MEITIKVNGRMINITEKEDNISQMDLYTREIGQMIKDMAQEFTHAKKEFINKYMKKGNLYNKNKQFRKNNTIQNNYSS